MTLDLTPFQAPAKYPKVKVARQNKEMAIALMDGYSGETSELTTVLQYSYHSLLCSRRYREVGEVMRGIFHVETLHLELLGDCICKLGCDPRYLLQLREKQAQWQSGLVYYGSSPAQMLLSDLEGEKQAVVFYLQSAALAQATQPEVAKLLARLAEDEKLHVKMLRELHRKYFLK